MSQLFRERLADDVMERYTCWREASVSVELAYDGWREALRGERRVAAAAYIAALDREQHAALVYAEAIERIGGRLAA